MAVSATPLNTERFQRFLNLLTREKQPYSKYGETGCVLGSVFGESMQELKEFEVRPDDIWVITPPKCGTTWTQEMVWLLMHGLDFNGAKKPLFDRFPYLEISRVAVKERLEELGMSDMVDYTRKLPSPRTIKSHLHKELLPDQLWTKKPKIIYVAREPKDVAVSFYYHYELFFGYAGEKELYFECFLEDEISYSPFWEHMLEFWKMKDEPNILFNTYEEMKEDLPRVIKRTAHFLGKTVTEDQIQRLAEHLDIKQMKRNPAVNIEDLVKTMRTSDDQAFIRKGEVGEGRKEMSPEMAARFDERTRRVFCAEVGGSPWGF